MFMDAAARDRGDCIQFVLVNPGRSAKTRSNSTSHSSNAFYQTEFAYGSREIKLGVRSLARAAIGGNQSSQKKEKPHECWGARRGDPAGPGQLVGALESKTGLRQVERAEYLAAQAD
jgi:hypothetical protein